MLYGMKAFDIEPRTPSQTNNKGNTMSEDFASVLALPAATPGAIASQDASPAQADASAAPPDSATPAPDANGEETFNPAIHEVDKTTGLPRRSKLTGRLCLKRGNGSRIAAGKPPAGACKSHLVLPPDVVKQQAAATMGTAPAAPPQAGGTVPMPTGPVSVQVVPPPEPAAPPPVPLGDYEATAAGVTHATWAFFQMLGGEKWTPSPEEVGDWSRVWQRIWHRYQWPVVGPLFELVFLFCKSAAKRADTGKMRGFIAGAWRWARGGRFRDEQPEGPGRAAEAP